MSSVAKYGSPASDAGVAVPSGPSSAGSEAVDTSLQARLESTANAAPSLDLSIGLAAKSNSVPVATLPIAMLLSSPSSDAPIAAQDRSRMVELGSLFGDFEKLLQSDYTLEKPGSLAQARQLYHRAHTSLAMLAYERQTGTEEVFRACDDLMGNLNIFFQWISEKRPYDNFHVRLLHKTSRKQSVWDEFLARITRSDSEVRKPIEVSGYQSRLKDLYATYNSLKECDYALEVRETSSILIHLSDQLIAMFGHLNSNGQVGSAIFFNLNRRLTLLRMHHMWLQEGKPCGNFREYINSEKMQKWGAENFYLVFVNALLPPSASDADRREFLEILKIEIPNPPGSASKPEVVLFPPSSSNVSVNNAAGSKPKGDISEKERNRLLEFGCLIIDFETLLRSDYDLRHSKSLEKVVQLHRQASDGLINLARDGQIPASKAFKRCDDWIELLNRCLHLIGQGKPYDNLSLRQFQDKSKNPRAFDKFLLSARPGLLQMNSVNAREIQEKLTGLSKKFEVLKRRELGFKEYETCSEFLENGDELVKLSLQLNKNGEMRPVIFYSLSKQLFLIRLYCMWLDERKPYDHFHHYLSSEQMHKWRSENYYTDLVTTLLHPKTPESDKLEFEGLLREVMSVPVNIPQARSAHQTDSSADFKQDHKMAII